MGEFFRGKILSCHSFVYADVYNTILKISALSCHNIPGALRKFLTSTLTGDEATNDIKEMNKKLQRMLEETLSKNIVLQRVSD